MSDPRLEVQCARALARAARLAGAGSRQQVRAAARAFVRRHRRDRSYLAWALKCARGSSALAIALLGLAAPPAHARSTSFLERSGAANPFAGLTFFSSPHVAPYLWDLDRDRDLDLVAIEAAETIRYFENTGSASEPAFLERTGDGNPFGGFTPPPGPPLAWHRAWVAGDVDGDGDLDIVGGNGDGSPLSFHENTGSATEPAFAERTGTANPFAGLAMAAYSEPALGDLDGDGDLDLGAWDPWYLDHSYFENTGSATEPAFAKRSGIDDPLRNLTQGSTVHFGGFGDLDGDADLDIVGAFGSPFQEPFIYYENTGAATRAAFVAHVFTSNPLDGHSFSAEFSIIPALGDLDADGDLDLVGGLYGDLHHLENVQANLVVPPWTAAGISGFPGAADVGSHARPALADLDRDGNIDLLAGAQDGTFSYFEVQPPVTAFFGSLMPRTGAANPMSGVDVGSYSAPAFADLDGDGDFDLASGEAGGTLAYFENTGSTASPAFVQRTGAANPLAGIDRGSESVAMFGDIDRDGDLDLFVGASFGGSGAFFQYLNTGSAEAPAFVASGVVSAYYPAGNSLAGSLGDVDGDGDLDIIAELGVYFENTRNVAAPALRFAQHDLARVAGFSAAAPALGDIDRDGDLDALVGQADGTFRYFRNAAMRPFAVAVHALVGPPDPFAGPIGGSYEMPSLGDLDGDGDPDLVAGSPSGELHFYENTGDAAIPRFAAAVPLPVPAPGTDSAPALADLDADGDLDLAAGESAGTLRYFENTGSAVDPAFAATTGASDPLAGLGVASSSAPSFGDLEADGDFDLAVGLGDGSIAYFQNTGDASTPTFAALTGAANPFGAIDVGDRATPGLADLDRDGDLDLVAGRFDGTLAYYENTGSATNPEFLVRAGASNPLDGIDLGSRSAAALGDLDAYGNADLVAGSSSGFDAYLLPEPARGLLFAAGAALLGALARITRAADPARTRTGSRARSAR